jgi:hypothetical protein
MQRPLFEVAYNVKLKDNNEKDPLGNDYEQLLQDLKARFDDAVTVEERRRIITLSPFSWPPEKIADYFGCSVRFAKDTKALRKVEGVLPTIRKKLGVKFPTG